MTAGGVTDNNERLGRKAMDPRDLRALLQMTPMPYWATTTLIGLGLAASLAETLGISRRRPARLLDLPADCPARLLVLAYSVISSAVSGRIS
jgi:hypothetical protein